MPIPALTTAGLLPPGVHGATLAEVEQAFGLATPRRVGLFGKLQQFASIARSANVFTALFVDGSFVTDKPDPNDVDAVLEMPRANLPALLALPNRSALLDWPAVKATYGVHLFIQPAPSTMALFFQYLRPAEALVRMVPQDQQRGIVRVDL